MSEEDRLFHLLTIALQIMLHGAERESMRACDRALQYMDDLEEMWTA